MLILTWLITTDRGIPLKSYIRKMMVSSKLNRMKSWHGFNWAWVRLNIEVLNIATKHLPLTFLITTPISMRQDANKIEASKLNFTQFCTDGCQRLGEATTMAMGALASRNLCKKWFGWRSNKIWISTFPLKHQQITDCFKSVTST